MTVLHRVDLRQIDDVGHARRCAAQHAQGLGFSATELGRIAICVTEASTNTVQHGHGGELLLSSGNHGRPSLTMLALDRGPGMANVAQSMRDGHSSRGTSGNGLGAISRLSDTFDIFSAAGRGAAVLMQFWPGGRPPARSGMQFGGVSVPVQGEELCGDGWSAVERDDRAVVLVSDGLGHGPFAHEASATAVEAFERSAAMAPAEIVDTINGGLKSTRGAAAAVTEILYKHRTVRFCGVGNVSGAVVSNGRQRHMVSHHGTLGHDVRKLQEFQYPWSGDSLLILTTDGIQTRWDLDAYPGLSQRHPALIAGVLYRDFQRERDDSTVVVAREIA